MPVVHVDTNKSIGGRRGGTQLTMRFDEKDLAAYESVMGNLEHFPSDAAWAENRTARFANMQIKKAVTKRYATKQKNVQKAGTIHRASYTTPAVIEYKGAPMQLSEFRVTSPRAGAKGKQFKASALTPLGFEGRRAFVVTFQSGHRAVVERRTKSRLPLRTLYGSSVPKMVEGKTIQQLAPVISAKLEHYLIDRMNWRMKKAKGQL